MDRQFSLVKNPPQTPCAFGILVALRLQGNQHEPEALAELQQENASRTLTAGIRLASQARNNWFLVCCGSINRHRQHDCYSVPFCAANAAGLCFQKSPIDSM